MKSFKDLNIEDKNVFVGRSIEIFDVIGQQIIVSKFKIEPSKFPERGNGNRTVLQIKYENIERIIFTNSIILQEAIQQVKPDDFPFTTTIIKLAPKGFKFT